MEQKSVSVNYRVYRWDELPVEDQQLIALAKEQTQKSYAPYSHFAVGAALRLENGRTFAGSNQENAAYPSGLCAERTVMFFANAQEPEIPVTDLAIAAYANGDFTHEAVAPCGACRQVLLETEVRFATPVRILLYGREAIFVLDSIKELLPLCFTKESMY